MKAQPQPQSETLVEQVQRVTHESRELVKEREAHAKHVERVAARAGALRRTAFGSPYHSRPNGQRIGGKIKGTGITAGLIAHSLLL